jgi:hypothetical protein
MRTMIARDRFLVSRHFKNAGQDRENTMVEKHAAEDQRPRQPPGWIPRRPPSGHPVQVDAGVQLLGASQEERWCLAANRP